jgi:hypothetical protein
MPVAGDVKATERVDTAPKPNVWEPYIQILVGLLVLFNSFGLVQPFSIFRPHYASLFHRSPSATDVFLIYLVGTFSGKALDAGYYKQCLRIGIMLQLVGIKGLVPCNLYELSLIFCGVVQGIGHDMMFCPTIANTALYFSERSALGEDRCKQSRLRISQATAMSIASCGAATGGLVFDLTAKYTLNNYGAPWTLRIIGLVGLFNSLLIFALAKEHPKTKTPTASKHVCGIVEWTAFENLSYTLYILAMCLVFLGLWTPYFYSSPTSVSRLFISSTNTPKTDP